MSTLPMPAHTSAFDGVEPQMFLSADGWMYVVFCGSRGNRFGTHVFRIWPANGHPEWVELPEFTEARAGAVVEPDGLYIMWYKDRARNLYRVKVPGFVTRGYPTNGQTVGSVA